MVLLAWRAEASTTGACSVVVGRVAADELSGSGVVVEKCSPALRRILQITWVGLSTSPPVTHMLQPCIRVRPLVGEGAGMTVSHDALRDLFSRNGWVAARADLLALGMSSAAIGRKVASGEWCAVVPGVYRSSHLPLSAELRVRATVLRLGPDAVVAGRWAAWWHGLTTAPHCPVRIHLPATASRPQWTGVSVTRRPLPFEDRLVFRGLVVTARARTVVDCASMPDGGDICDQALQRGTTLTALQDALDRLSPGTGSVAARRLLQPLRVGGVSHPERRPMRALRGRGLLSWQPGVHTDTAAGRFWLDLAIVELRLAVEVDGWTVHSRAEAFHTDRERQNALVRAGWTVYRYTPRRLQVDLEAVVDELAAVEVNLRRRLGQHAS